MWWWWKRSVFPARTSPLERDDAAHDRFGASSVEHMCRYACSAAENQNARQGLLSQGVCCVCSWLQLSDLTEAGHMRAAAAPLKRERDEGAAKVRRLSSCEKLRTSRDAIHRRVPYSRLPFPQKSSRTVAAVDGKSRHVAGKSRACGGLVRCFRIILARGAHSCAP